MRESGCRIRLITTNSSNRALAELIAQRVPEAMSREMHVAHVKTALNSLSRISGCHPSGGSVELRVLDTLPPFGIFAVDSDKPSGRIRIELYPLTVVPLERDQFSSCVLHVMENGTVSSGSNLKFFGRRHLSRRHRLRETCVCQPRRSVCPGVHFVPTALPFSRHLW
jgi:hypothetical protein